MCLSHLEKAPHPFHGAYHQLMARAEHMRAQVLECLRLDRPMMPMLEVEDKHKPLTRNDIRQQLRALDAPVLDASGQRVAASTYAEWFMEEATLAAGLGAAPHADAVFARLFASEPIEWTRIGVFQDVSTCPAVALSTAPLFAAERAPCRESSLPAGEHAANRRAAAAARGERPRLPAR